MSTHEDDQGAGRYGQQPPHEGYPPYGGQPYGGPPQSGRPGQESGGSPYGRQDPPPGYGQQHPAAPGWGQQPDQYGQQHGQGYEQGYEQYGQQYGQTAPYGQTSPYGQGAPYGQATPYGYGGYAPAPTGKPGGVVTAAVLGFVFGAFGVVITLAAFILGAVATGAANGVDDVPGLGTISGAIGGAIFVVAVLALLWTVVVIWGSVWALTGRSRVLLLVGGSIAILFTGLGLIGNLSDSASSSAGDVVASLLFFAAAVAIVVLLSVRRAGQWFAAVRAARGR